jgi:hypothetical protein
VSYAGHSASPVVYEPRVEGEQRKRSNRIHTSPVLPYVRARDPSKSVGETAKLIGNSAFGGLLIYKEKHRRVYYVKGKANCMREANKPNFVKCTELEGEIFEIQARYRSIIHNSPMLVRFFILQYAKLRKLQFYYDFLSEYIDRKDFVLTQMDTDSLYMGIVGRNLIDCVKLHLRGKFIRSTEGNCDASIF